jgi:hypothetical protein
VEKKGGGAAGRQARAALRRSNVSINEATAGSAAPGTHVERGPVDEPGDAPYHVTIHTEAYDEEVGVTDEATARAILRVIEEDIKNGNFPH